MFKYMYQTQLREGGCLLAILALGLPSKFLSENMLRHRLGTVYVILQKKVIRSRNSVCLGKAHSEGRKGTEFREEMFFQSGFLFHEQVQNEIPFVFLLWEMVWNGIPSIFKFCGMVQSE